jgi:hypothetical protein
MTQKNGKEKAKVAYDANSGPLPAGRPISSILWVMFPIILEILHSLLDLDLRAGKI